MQIEFYPAESIPVARDAELTAVDVERIKVIHATNMNDAGEIYHEIVVDYGDGTKMLEDDEHMIIMPEDLPPIFLSAAQCDLIAKMGGGDNSGLWFNRTALDGVILLSDNQFQEGENNLVDEHGHMMDV